jgi:aldehyde:ferredoxin oxidoreductase
MEEGQKGGVLPTLNFQENIVPTEAFSKTSRDNFLKKYHVRQMACFSCR